MSKQDDLFHPTQIDEQIETFSSTPDPNNLVSTSQMICDLYQVQQEDRATIARVWTRLAERSAEKRQAGVEQSRVYSRSSWIKDQDRRKEPQSMSTITRDKHSQKKYRRSLEILAAVIIVGILVSSMVVVFRARQSSSAHPGTLPAHQGTSLTPSTPQASPSGIYLSTKSGIDKISLKTSKVLWHISLDWAGQPFVLGNTVFFNHEISSSYNLQAVNATTGKRIWSKNYGSSTFLLQAHGILYDSTCLAASNGENSGCYIYAINPANGAKLWSFATTQGTAWITIQDNVVYGASYAHLFALNAATGKPLWQKTLPYPNQEIAQTPLVVDHVLYAASCNTTKGTSNYLGCYFLAFNTSNGSALWHTPASQSIWTSPTSANGVLYYGAAGQGLIYAVNAHTGAVTWTYTACPGDCSISNLTATQDTLYAQVNNNQSTSLLALNPTKRSVLWSKNLAASYGQPLIINQELIYVVASDSRIEALNASNGTTVKSYTDATATITGFILVA